MDVPQDKSVERVVARFFKDRRKGRRVSVDDAIEGAKLTWDGDGVASAGGQCSRSDLRTAAIREISRQTRIGASAMGATHDAGGGVLLPELEGYDVIDCVGAGGMGAVYEAYQRSTGRRVAVKFMLDHAAATQTARQRFEREVELVARLEHPAIVSVIDSGLHEGRNYYVMEFVEGAPLDEAIRPGKCDTAQALGLVARIADAVDYAHQRGVLHRDLKPSNIIIDGRGEPHLLDFGLAKAIRPGAAPAEMTLSTPGQLLGTLAFMPPEQSKGQHERISVRSDVYSLGAIAYELVTGELPCDVDGPMGEVLLRIAQKDPAPPSSLRKRLSRDVDAILLKALEKDPSRRYATAAEFAADIRRSLSHMPISARRTGLPTKIARWARRNPRVAVTAGTSVVLLALVSVIASVLVHSAETAAADLDWYSDVISEIKEIDLNTPQGNAAATALYDRAAHRVARLHRFPGKQADLQSEIGIGYKELGRYDKSLALLGSALETRRGLFSDEHPLVAESLHNYASTLYRRGEYEKALRSYEEALVIWRALHDTNKRQADVVRGLAGTLDHLGSTCTRLYDADRAEQFYQEARDLRGSYFGAKSIEVAMSENNLGMFLNSELRFGEAETHCRIAIDLVTTLVGKQHQGYGVALGNLAASRLGIQEFAEAESLAREAIEQKRELLQDPSHPSVAVSLATLAEAQIELGKLVEAEQACADGLRILEERSPDNLRDLAGTLLTMGRVQLELHGPNEAEPHFARALRIRERYAPSSAPPHWTVAEAQQWLGDCLLRSGRVEEARPLLEQSVGPWLERRSVLSEGDLETERTLSRMIRLYEALGDENAAKPYRDRLSRSSVAAAAAAG